MSRQAVYWAGTITFSNDNDMICLWGLYGDDGEGCIKWMKGQAEVGNSVTRYKHWQVVVLMSTKKSLRQMKDIDGVAHWEPSRSSAIETYVWKEDTRVEGSQFMYGEKPHKANSRIDYGIQMELARAGKFDEMDKGVYFKYKKTAESFYRDNIVAVYRDNVKIKYFHGGTSTGKSHAARLEAGEDAYWKLSTNKWWDGYKGELNVVIDEMVPSVIGIAHLLRWFDKYKCICEVKGGSIGLRATNFWITSNLKPEILLADEKEVHQKAFMRRLTEVREFLIKYT